MNIGDVLVEYVERPTAGHALPVLTLTERHGFVRQEDRFKKRLATDDTSAYKVVRRNAIAFNPYLLWAGAVAQNTIVDAGIISPLYPTFRVREGFDPRFVARLLLTEQLISAYDGIAFGSVPRRRRSSVKDFLELPLPPQPPIGVQRRMTAILDRADDLRVMRNEVLAHLDSLPNACFEATFSSADFTRRPIAHHLVDQQIGLDRSAAEQGLDRKYDYIKMDAITRDGKLDLASLTRINASTEEVARYSLVNGDLLLNTRNSKALVGKTAVYRGRPRLYNNNIMRMRFDQDLLPEYVHRYLWSSEGRRQLETRKAGTTNVYAIYAKSIATLEIPVPPLPLQRDFAACVGLIEAHRAVVEDARKVNDELFTSLQSRAFRGEL